MTAAEAYWRLASDEQLREAWESLSSTIGATRKIVTDTTEELEAEIIRRAGRGLTPCNPITVRDAGLSERVGNLLIALKQGQ